MANCIFYVTTLFLAIFIGCIAVAYVREKKFSRRLEIIEKYVIRSIEKLKMQVESNYALIIREKEREGNGKYES